MKIQEADAKSLLVAQGLPVPDWDVAHTVEEARVAADRFFSAGAQQVVIKAQVLVGGRGKAGGVKLAGFPEQAELIAGTILGGSGAVVGTKGDEVNLPEGTLIRVRLDRPLTVPLG